MRSWKLFLLTVCPRSASNFTCSLLRLHGLKIGRETLDTDGAVNGVVPFHIDKLAPFDLIFQQVRSPLAVIASMYALKGWSRAATYFPLGDPFPTSAEGKLVRNMRNWWYWHDASEAAASWCYKIEDLLPKNYVLGPIYQEWCDRLQIKPLSHIPKHTRLNENSRRGSPDYRVVSWDDLEAADQELYKKIRDKAFKYGYET